MGAGKKPRVCQGKAVDVKFIADVHLAKVAKYLRLLGFDTLYFRHIEDDILVKFSQQRIVLTKDRALAKRSKNIYLVQSKEIKKQLIEVLRHFAISSCHPFTRCLIDNTLLQRVAKEHIINRLPPRIKQDFNQFWICPRCQRLYWHGSHYERMLEVVYEVCGEIRAQVVLVDE